MVWRIGSVGVGDFNASAGTLFIEKSKGGQRRYVHLDLEAARFFREVCINRDPGETMFLRKSGEPWIKDNQKKPMRRACTAAEIKRCGFHQLRHTAASRWITLGVTLKVVAEQLGHVDTKMVDRYYGHLASGHMARTFRVLPGVGLDKAARSCKWPLPGTYGDGVECDPGGTRVKRARTLGEVECCCHFRRERVRH